MEKIEYHDQEQVKRLQWYIESFQKRMSNDMKQPDFEPTARQEDDWYDGVVTELNNKLDTMGIDKSEIFTSLEKTNHLLLSCLQWPETQDKMNTDQLYHFLISSTRRPYHDSLTRIFHPSGNYEVNDVLNSLWVAKLLLKEKEKLEQIKTIKHIIEEARTEFDTLNKDVAIRSKFANEFTKTVMKNGWLKKLPLLLMLSSEEQEKFYTVLNHKKSECWTDLIYTLLCWGIPWEDCIHSIGSQKLAQAIIAVFA